MNIKGFSDSALLMLYNSIDKALKEDDSRQQNEIKEYQVREYKDWRIWSDSIEEELIKRNVEFEKIKW